MFENGGSEAIPAIPGALDGSTYASPCKHGGRPLLLAPPPTNVELSEMILEINNFGMGISGKPTGYVNSAALLPRKSKLPHSPAFAPGLPPRLKQLWRDKTERAAGTDQAILLAAPVARLARGR